MADLRLKANETVSLAVKKSKIALPTAGRRVTSSIITENLSKTTENGD